MKVLVNTVSTKKHAGGAFQVAINFLMKTLEYSNIEWFYITSQDIDNVVGKYFSKINGSKYFVFPTQPDFIHSYSRVKKQIQTVEDQILPDVVYSISAPSYFTFKAPEVMRFTNPWVTHPNSYAWSVLSIKEKVFYYLYGLNQKRIIKKARFFITQTETCAKGIQKITKVPLENIKVVANVLPAAFKSLDNSPVIDNDCINIACVGAATTHKNFDIIPSVLYELQSLSYNNVKFHVTLPEDEPTLGLIIKKAQALGLEHCIINHGRLSQIELGEMYRRCQFCFLPTLLEVFSASTLEAMYYGLPIVATDFTFNRDVLADSALYYKPKDPRSAASQFAEILQNDQLQKEFKKRMKGRLELYNDYDSHFDSIVSFLKKVITRAL